MYRPQIKVIDCTIRDGGLMNDSKFPLETVQKVYRAVCAAGVDIVELGYRIYRTKFIYSHCRILPLILSIDIYDIDFNAFSPQRQV